MRRILSIGMLLFAWLCANGLLLDAAQVFAWSRMFAGYSETMTVGAALRETFDPNKPCELCVGVAEARDAQDAAKAPLAAQNDVKLVLALEASPVVVFSAPASAWPAASPEPALVRRDPVPVPPPRV